MTAAGCPIPYTAMAQVRIPSSDELYAAGLVSGKAYVCRFMRCCKLTGRRMPCIVVPSDALQLSVNTVLEDVHMKVRVRVGMLVEMTARGLITPVYSSHSFDAYAPRASVPLPKEAVVQFMTPVVVM